MAWYTAKVAGFIVKVATWYNLIIDAIKAASFTKNVVAIDLSGGAQIIPILHADAELTILKVIIVYINEASSADAGVEIRVGKETDENYFVSETSEINKAEWYEKEATLLQTILTAGDTLTVGSVGGKAGTGELQIYVWYTDA